MTRRRRLLLGGMAVVIVLAGLPVAVYLEARSDIARELASLEVEIADERARVEALRHPCLRGEPIDEPAGPRLAPLLADARFGAVMFRVRDRDRIAGQPLVAATQAVLEEHRSAIEPLRAALRCTRDSPPLFEVPVARDHSSEVEGLVTLLLLAAYERAGAGDVRGAVELALDGARAVIVAFRAVGARDGPLWDAETGALHEKLALETLGDLVANMQTDAALRRQIERELDLLAASRPTAAQVWRQHGIARRLELCSTGLVSGVPAKELVEAQGEVRIGGWQGLVPRTVLVAHALHDVNEILDARRPAGQRPPLSMLEESSRPLAALYGTRWNPLVRAFVSVTGSGWIHSEREGFEAVLRAALVVEDHRGAGGVFPEAAAMPVLPLDPCSENGAQPIRYERESDGSGWRLWSVGNNRRDDGGAIEFRDMKFVKDDVLLERRRLR